MVYDRLARVAYLFMRACDCMVAGNIGDARHYLLVAHEEAGDDLPHFLNDCLLQVHDELEVPLTKPPRKKHATAKPFHSVSSCHSELTPREREVLLLTAQGLRNQEIADQLSLSLRTVQNHLQNCYTKLGVRNRMEAVQVGLIERVVGDGR